MEYHFQITLKKIEITDPAVKDPKVIAQLLHNGVSKRITNPRFIRNRIGSFYLQRLSVTINDLKEPNNQVTLKISSLSANSMNENFLGVVEFDLSKLFARIGKELTRAESHRDELQSFTLEYDLLLSIKKNPESFLESESQDSLSVDTNEQCIGAYSTPIEVPEVAKNTSNSTAFEKKDSLKKMSFQKKEEPKRVAETTENTPTKQQQIPSSPSKSDNSPSFNQDSLNDEGEDKDEEAKGERSKKPKITRKESGNTARANVFKSKRNSKNGDSQNQSNTQTKEQENESPIKVSPPPQKVSPMHKSKSNVPRPEEMTAPQSPILAKSKTPPKIPDLPSSPKAASGYIFKKQTIHTTPGNHKVRVLKLEEAKISDTNQQDQPTAVNDEQAQPPNPYTDSNKNPLTRKLTPPPQNPQIHLFDKPKSGGTLLDKLKLPHFQTIEQQADPRKAKQPNTTPQPIIGKPKQSSLTKQPFQEQKTDAVNQDTSGNNTTPTNLKKRSSFKLSKDNEDSLTKKPGHVKYPIDVSLREVNSELQKYQHLYTKRDVNLNILFALVALVLGYFIGTF